MRCHVINLDSAPARRAGLEASFARASAPGWALSRIAATPAAEVTTPGRLSPAEKACFISHRRALEAAAADPGHSLILEDDVAFWPLASGPLTDALARPGWDLLFLNIALGDAGSMVSMAKARRTLAAEGRFKLVDLTNVHFASACAYVVHSEAKRRVLELVGQPASLDQPFDLRLRDLVHARKLRASVLLPFVVTFSEDAEQSQIQPAIHKASEVVSGAFRELMYVGRDLAACGRTADRILSDIADEEARAIGAVFAGIVSPAFDR